MTGESHQGRSFVGSRHFFTWFPLKQIGSVTGQSIEVSSDYASCLCLMRKVSALPREWDSCPVSHWDVQYTQCSGIYAAEIHVWLCEKVLLEPFLQEMWKLSSSFAMNLYGLSLEATANMCIWRNLCKISQQGVKNDNLCYLLNTTSHENFKSIKNVLKHHGLLPNISCWRLVAIETQIKHYNTLFPLSGPV